MLHPDQNPIVWFLIWETGVYVSTGQESKDFENKKLEKDCKNEQEKEKYGTAKAEKEASLPPCSSKMMVKGLSNLGNTCFFNAVLQNLYQTSILRELLKEVKMTGTTVQLEPLYLCLTEPLLVTLEQTPGPLTAAMCQFFTEMQETKGATVTPKELFSQICKKAVRFKGYQQQDSQELLRYLLDGMRAEEIQRLSAAIIKTQKDSTEKIEEELKKKVKEYEKKRAVPNFVDRIFGGELTSTIMCEECRSVSLVHETFLDLSLPVLDDQVGKKNTAQRNAKMYYEKKSEEDEDSYMKEKTDTLTAPSKHLQKKAKKQAKKQAKNQRQQQKIQDKLLPLNDVSQKCNTPQEIKPETENVEQQAESLNKDDHGINQTELNKENVIYALGEEENRRSSEQDTEDKISTDDTLETLFSITEENSRFDNSYQKDDSNDEEDLVNAITELNLRSAVEPSDDHTSIFDSETSGTKLFEIVSEDTERAFSTLAERKEIKTSECSVQNCLYQFTQNEKLSETNKVLCSVCTRRQPNGPKANRGDEKHVYTNAIKQMLISLPPLILTLHLKRFQQAGFNLRKVTKHVQFPEVLDLAPFCALKCKGVAEGETQVLYSLYGIVEHSGTMRSGHYTAYVKVQTPNAPLSDLVIREIKPPDSSTEPPRGQWFHISDNHVQAVPTKKVLSSQAYLLFYERIV
ncbi:ubiquitin carboxyl-terminal hydrolase 16 isoform X2 [Microcaecilia unicolor]|uniref:Ubiquitin carboxyl-terminal hydrolase n=1 Tax=Microcaecilia unicolor TaxID=1415580 RepID=A0A6P7YAT9_9AMPH|nr:ubiquitin carboxyl-terminal hydrolase 16 isoform X2 [Microcaecilia unicolor]XP_030060145.1 ubiquitin carboxyl-terminal hydrolase 16 isoform X2 [Microcaecilia unicolor]